MLDPVSALAVGANVAQILSTLSSPITGAIKARRVRKAVAKIIDRVSSDFVRANPEALGALKGSSRAIAEELSNLRGGTPMEARILAREWTGKGGLDEAGAQRLATAYVQALHRALLSIDGFREVLEAGANVLSAEV